jgi:hypothetical protein
MIAWRNEMSQTIYSLSPAGIRQLSVREGAISPTALLYALTLVVSCGLAGNAPLWALVLSCSLLALLLPKSIRNVRRMEETWRNFQVILDESGVTVRRGESIESIVSKEDIRKVTEWRGRGLNIKTSRDPWGVRIPSLIGGYKELKNRLAMWAPIDRGGSAQLWMYCGIPAGLAIYASALMVRSRYVFFPLFMVSGFYLLRFARISIKTWTRPSRPHEIQDPLWIVGFPFPLLGLLVIKSVWMLF